jgi:hypothetical protein
MSIEATAIVTATPKHIEAVRKKIEEIRKSISGRFFDLGELLKEIRDGGFHMTWGFANFGEWLGSSGLDLKERSAYYLIKIIEMGKELEIPREQLEGVKISKLREISTLDPKTEGDQIKRLIQACTPNAEGEEEMSLDEVRESVAKVKAGDDKIATYVFMTIKVTKTVKEEVIDPAIEIARAIHGDTINSDSEPQEISPARAIELICADFLANADPSQEKEPEPELPVERPALPHYVLDAEFVELEKKMTDNLVKSVVEGFKDAEVEYHVTSDVTTRFLDEVTPPPPTDRRLRVIDAEVIAPDSVVMDGLASDDDSDPRLEAAVKFLTDDRPEGTANDIKLHFRIGEIRAFKLFKAARAAIDAK